MWGPLRTRGRGWRRGQLHIHQSVTATRNLKNKTTVCTDEGWRREEGLHLSGLSGLVGAWFGWSTHTQTPDGQTDRLTDKGPNTPHPTRTIPHLRSGLRTTSTTPTPTRQGSRAAPPQPLAPLASSAVDDALCPAWREAVSGTRTGTGTASRGTTPGPRRRSWGSCKRSRL